jgi:hypothetical protein
MPLKAIYINDAAHRVIRDSNGSQVDYLPSSGRCDILIDFQIPAMYLESGMWTLNVDVRLKRQQQFVSTCHWWGGGGLRNRIFGTTCRLNVLIVYVSKAFQVPSKCLQPAYI